MEEEDFEDYLVDKAKEIINEETETNENELDIPEAETREDVQKAEKEGKRKIPTTWDPQEIEHLMNNRKSMSNSEMKQFLEKDSELQEELDKVDDWKGFNKWEERFMIQNNLNMEPEEIAQELDRDEKEVRLKMRMLGFNTDF